MSRPKPVAYRDSEDFNAVIYCLKCVSDEDKVCPVYGNPDKSICELCGKTIPLGDGLGGDHPNASFTRELRKNDN
jgi:hypothetical protein